MHVNPGVVQAMLGLERQVRQAGLDHKLLDLVQMRASQINGCAYCLDMHSKDARAPARPSSASTASTPGAKRRTTGRERAALEWTEALTLVSKLVCRRLYERVREQFTEEEIVHLTLAVVVINGWNRLDVAVRTVPGAYVAGSLAKMHAAV